MKKRTPYCDNGKLSPLNDLQARLDRLKTLVPEQYKRNDNNNNNYNSRRNKRNLTKEERWAKRISRRMELEETYGDESQRSACNVDLALLDLGTFRPNKCLIVHSIGYRSYCCFSHALICCVEDDDM